MKVLLPLRPGRDIGGRKVSDWEGEEWRARDKGEMEQLGAAGAAEGLARHTGRTSAPLSSHRPADKAARSKRKGGAHRSRSFPREKGLMAPSAPT